MLLSEIASRVDAIAAEDYSMYQGHFAECRTGAVYANSWAYITQACRGVGDGLGLKYAHGGVLYSIGSHRGHYVVVNPLGPLHHLPAVIDYLQAESGKPVFLKKLSPAAAAFLDLRESPRVASVYENAAPSAGAYTWDTDAYADDDTYPEQIIDIDVTSRHGLKMAEWFHHYTCAIGVSCATGVSCAADAASIGQAAPPDPDSIWRSYRQFRRSVRHFSDSGAACRIEAFQPSLLPQVEGFVQSYFGDERGEARHAYANLLTGLASGIRADSEFCYIMWVSVEHTAVRQMEQPIAGLVFVERLDPVSAGIYARLVPRSLPCLPEYVMSQVLMRLREHGIQRVNLGGSETAGLHAFKRKLAPVEERYIPLLVCGHGVESPYEYAGQSY